MHHADFDWDDANIDHLADHNVTPTEAEDALLDPDRIPWQAHSTATEKRYGLVGMTEDGRILLIAYTYRGSAVRIVTAYEPSDRVKSRYRRRNR